MADFPRVSIPGCTPLWQTEANAFFQERIRPELDEWVRRMVLLDHTMQDVLLIRLLAGNPWWLNLVAQSPRWQELKNRG